MNLRHVFAASGITPQLEAFIGRAMREHELDAGHGKRVPKTLQERITEATRHYPEIIEAIRDGHTTCRAINAHTGLHCNAALSRMVRDGTIGVRKVKCGYHEYSVMSDAAEDCR